MQVNEGTTHAKVPAKYEEQLSVPIDVCAFCGNSDELEILQIDINTHRVQCNACSARGPVGDTPFQSIQLWNRCYREQSYFDLPITSVERRESIVTFSPSIQPKAKHAKNHK